MSTTNTSSAPATGNNTATTTGATAATKPKQKLNVHKFPRPPLCERTDRALLIKWGDAVVAETKRGEAYWVLETTHPPTYYLPLPSLNTANVTLSTVPRYSTMCEWKGAATYHNLTLNSTNETVSRKIWSYEKPTSKFREIKDHLCFYASSVPWKCFVDGEEVQPQEGDFYGGWVTSELEGPMKGGPGTWGW
ncbi:hypothetical protein H2198_003213 [Neophaeococcomyces mojaviensis]|uniref:Uncharacterized protein n=1 Tax=Neophaeococcomyces mojaviensis TaxID=3383035 RepID=A0ACC3AC27_9EURO|nr:hypothetical protein H2198_003213 [Knufia sp. JES_112]